MGDSAMLFSLETIKDLDRGKVAAAVDLALRQCVLDAQDRPGDDSARKVQLVMEVRPVLDSDTGKLDTCELQFKVVTTLPKRQSVAYPMLPKADGGLIFQPGSPLDPRQNTFGFEAGTGETALDEEPEPAEPIRLNRAANQ